LGVKGSALPRLVYNTIGAATDPPKMRGAAGGYSHLDVALIRLGRSLLNIGLLPHRTRVCLDSVRAWVDEIVADPRLGTADEKFILTKKAVFLLARQDESGFGVELVNSKQIISALTGTESAQPQTVIYLEKALAQAFTDLQEFLDSAED